MVLRIDAGRPGSSMAHGRQCRCAANVRLTTAAATDAASEGDCIVVTGSLYTVADARRALEGTP